MRRLSWLLLPALAGCASADPQRAGLVWLDAEARDAGVTLTIDGDTVDRTLPTAVDGDDVAIVTSAGKSPLDVAPGDVLVVRGPTGEVDGYTLGVDATADGLRVWGSEDAAAALADDLGADVDGASDGSWLLAGEDALWAAADAAEPEDLDQIDPVPPVAVGQTAGTAPVTGTTSPFGRWAAVTGGSRQTIGGDPLSQADVAAGSASTLGNLGIDLGRDRAFDHAAGDAAAARFVGRWEGDRCVVLASDATWTFCDGADGGRWGASDGALTLTGDDGEPWTLTPSGALLRGALGTLHPVED